MTDSVIENHDGEASAEADSQAIVSEQVNHVKVAYVANDTNEPCGVRALNPGNEQNNENILNNRASAELPVIAKVLGEPLQQLPKDLYIPPGALRVILDAFEGPLDLLLYLIRRQNIDILNIPIAKITDQYMEYIQLLQDFKFELAAEYLLMAAMLAEIKSRLLLPRPVEIQAEENDPRAELIRRLQEYERFKKAAEDLSVIPRMDRDLFPSKVDLPDMPAKQRYPDTSLKELLFALRDALVRVDQFSHHHVNREPLSMREKMSQILEKITSNEFMPFSALMTIEEGRMGVVVSFMAILELLRQALIEMVQIKPFGPIHIKAASETVTVNS